MEIIDKILNIINEDTDISDNTKKNLLIKIQKEANKYKWNNASEHIPNRSDYYEVLFRDRDTGDLTIESSYFDSNKWWTFYTNKILVKWRVIPK